MPSLRINPRKKAIFEQAVESPSKKIKTKAAPSTRSIPSYDLSHTSTTVQEPNMSGPHTTIQKRQHPRHTPKQHKFTLSRPSLNQTTLFGATSAVDRDSLPLQSSVPSLITDADSSDTSTCSNTGSSIRGPSQQQRERKQVNRADTPTEAHPSSSQNGQPTEFEIALANAAERASSYTDSGATQPSEVNTFDHRQYYLMSVLENASAALQEMEVGHPIEPRSAATFHPERERYLRDSFSVPPMESIDIHDKASNNIDVEMLALLDGVLAELATGFDHGHGLRSLPITISRYQHTHCQRFHDCLKRFRNEATPLTNVFLHPDATSALSSIYRCLAQRVQQISFAPHPMSFAPSAYQPAMYSTERPIFRIVTRPSAQYLTNSPSAAPAKSFQYPNSTIVPSNAPPLVKLAPKTAMFNKETEESDSTQRTKFVAKQPSASATVPKRRGVPQDDALSTSSVLPRGSKRKRDALVDEMSGIKISTNE